MDLVDIQKYGSFEVDHELYKAYGDVFTDSESAQIVLKDLVQFCGYGMVTDDVEMMKRIMERSAVIFRIKSMLNGVPVERETDDE